MENKSSKIAAIIGIVLGCIFGAHLRDLISNKIVEIQEKYLES